MYENLIFINCGGTYCYVIQGYQGDVLIDTGEKRYRNEIEMWLLNFNIKIIILTHGHNDCIENAAYFSKLYNAEVYMTEADYELAKNNMSRSFYACGLSGQLISSAAFKIMKSLKSILFMTDISLRQNTESHAILLILKVIPRVR